MSEENYNYVQPAVPKPPAPNGDAHPVRETASDAVDAEAAIPAGMGDAEVREPARIEPRGVDVSGIDVPTEAYRTGSYAPVSAESNTESFQASRMGDTDTMPASTGAFVGRAAAAPVSSGAGYEPSARFESGYASQPASAPYESGYASQPASAPYESGYASQPRVAYSRENEYYSQQTARVSARPPYSSANQAPGAPAAPRSSRASKEAKAKTGAGKTFLFGFLGALAACALAIGGFAFATGGTFNTAPSQHSALIGTTDQSVINAVDEGQTLAEAVAAKALPSVVAIYSYQNAQSSQMFGFGYGYGTGGQGDDSLVQAGMGSGVVISDDGYIITNYHVVEDAAKLTVSIDGNERDATYVGGDSSSDIAVIKVKDASGLVPADIGNSDDLRIGEWVMTVGAPLGLESSVATGVVSATNRSTIMDSSSSDPYSNYFGMGNATPEYTYYPNMIQTDAVINPGNSGGALVDADGKLIGINSMLSSYSGTYAGVGFAIPINYAIQIAQTVIDGKEPTHAIIGVTLSQVNSQIAQQYNLPADKGAYISAISPNTGAAESDLQVGDIITKVDGKAVASPTDVTLEVRAHKVGDTIPLTVNRDGEEKEIQVKLTSDENMTSNVGNQQNQNQNQGQGTGEGQGQDDGQGRGSGRGGYTTEELEEILKMLGM